MGGAGISETAYVGSSSPALAGVGILCSEVVGELPRLEMVRCGVPDREGLPHL